MLRKLPLNPSNHIPTPTIFSPPPRVLRAVREVDPTADLHYVSRGRWALGSVKPNAVRRGIAGRMKRRMEMKGARSKGAYRMALLHYRGFGHINLYDHADLPAVPEDFAKRDAWYRSGRERAFRQQEERSLLTAHHTRDVDEVIEEVNAREKELGPYIFRDRKNFPQPGLM